MSRKVIALSGWKGSGKDTVAAHLVEKHGFIRISFADRLKDMVAQQYNVPREFLDSPSHKEMPLVNLPVIPSDPFSDRIHLMLQSELSSGFWTPRALCILEGSIKRSVHSNYWTRSAIQTLLENPEQSYVISDMRYKSEADTLRLAIPSIQTMRIQRFASVNTHDSSERDLDDYPFDVHLNNTDGIELLHLRIDNYIGKMTHVPAE